MEVIRGGAQCNEARQIKLSARVLRDIRGYSSAGRAPALQAGGQRFDPAYLHQERKAEYNEAGQLEIG